MSNIPNFEHWCGQLCSHMEALTNAMNSACSIVDHHEARLSPPPAPAAEPCTAAEKGTGWREKCDVTEYGPGWYVDTGWGSGKKILFLAEGGRWGAATDVFYFPSESAARRALEQAAEPGVERADPASTPAAKFDAWAIADKIAYDPLLILASFRKDAIAAALTAAHAAGRAEGDAAGYAGGKAEQRAPEGCVINQNSEVLVAEPVHAAPCPFNPRHYTTEWLWRLTKQPAAPDAKEAGR